MLYRTDDPDLAGSCLVHQPPGSIEVEVLDSGVGGSSGPALDAPAGGFTQGAISSSSKATITDGAVGDMADGTLLRDAEPNRPW